MKDLTSENFESEVLKENGKVLVDFYATWCGPCKMLAPVLHGMEENYKGSIKFTRMDTDQAPDIAMQYGIQAIPTVILFENGAEKDRFVGLLDQASIERFLA